MADGNGGSSILAKVVLLLVIVAIVVLLHWFFVPPNQKQTERFAPFEGAVPLVEQASPPGVPQAAEDQGGEMYRPVDYSGVKYPRDCFPKDRATPEDLLPKDAANSLWAQVNPAGQGDLKNQSFLDAGYHVGIDTIGQTLKIPNLQLRSDPPIPKVQVSPWMQSTVDPDLNRRPFEIGGCD